MRVAPNHWVTLRYSLFDSMGDPLEQRDQQVRYMHGDFGMMFEKLEAALHNKSAGDEVSVYLEPIDHFGEYDANRLFIVPRAQFEGDVTVDMVIQGRPNEADDGQTYRVDQIAGDTVVLDGNHPYSEIALRFDMTIVNVEIASADEIAAQRAANEAEL